MKLKLNKIVEILSKIKDDDFYFKNYAPDIIESYSYEVAENFMCWCEDNKSWINNYSNRDKMVLFKIKKNEIS